MTYKEYGKWLAVGLFGFMGLSWDAMFFLSLIMGNGDANISEPNPVKLWFEFITLVVLSAAVLCATINHVLRCRKPRDFVA
jgi:hypothetical protein